LADSPEMVGSKPLNMAPYNEPTSLLKNVLDRDHESNQVDIGIPQEESRKR
tara:strand:- start:351 stop:503 length:153 start_codon:yes stop_codon:yes gene_type:complete